MQQLNPRKLHCLLAACANTFAIKLNIHRWSSKTRTVELMARIAPVSNMKSVTRGLKFHPKKANGHFRNNRIYIYISLLCALFTVLKEDMVFKYFSFASFCVRTPTEAEKPQRSCCHVRVIKLFKVSIEV